CAHHRVLFDQRRQSIDKLLNEILNVGPFGHFFSPPWLRAETSCEESTMQSKTVDSPSVRVKTIASGAPRYVHCRRVRIARGHSLLSVGAAGARSALARFLDCRRWHASRVTRAQRPAVIDIRTWRPGRGASNRGLDGLHLVGRD